MSHTHHGIDYIEFYATDMAASKAFYSAAFGWTFVDYGPGYAGIQKADGGEWGGLAQAETVVSGGPMVILYSDDLNATRDAVLATGTVLDKDIYSFPGGQRFEFKDPSGNSLAVWKSNAA